MGTMEPTLERPSRTPRPQTRERGAFRSYGAPGDTRWWRWPETLWLEGRKGRVGPGRGLASLWLAGDDVEFVAFRVGEGGPVRDGAVDLVELGRAEAGQPVDL